MNIGLEKALAKLAHMRGTSVQVQIKLFNADIIERRARMKVKPSLTDEERAARVKACKQRSLAKAREMRAAARALVPEPTAEEIAARITRASGDLDTEPTNG